ncbi:MAG: NERD domain-containing protein [Deferrisomatales bacterium]|nr:NERD domain-containing protein [Deferrisomatales bacterium]
MMRKEGDSSRSPIKRSPLRVAGQSLDEMIHQYLEDKAYALAALAVFMSTIALMEWWRWAQDLPPKPVLATVVAVLCWGWFFLWVPVHRRRLRQMRLGLEGERAIGEFLDNLRPKGFHVFHDVLGDGFNADHVVIFTVETKTLSKPVKGPPEIVYNGENIRVRGQTPD